MGLDLSWGIPSELAHRHEQRLLVNKERNDGGGKRTETTKFAHGDDDLFIKDEVPDHTAESAKDIILNNAASMDEKLAKDRCKQNL